MSSSILAIQAAVPRDTMAIVTGVRNFVRLLGSTLGVAVCGAIVQSSLRGSLARLASLTPAQVAALLNDPTVLNDPARFALSVEERDIILEAYTTGFRRVFYLAAACMAVSTGVALALIEQHRLDRDDDAERKEMGREATRRGGEDAKDIKAEAEAGGKRGRIEEKA